METNGDVRMIAPRVGFDESEKWLQKKIEELWLMKVQCDEIESRLETAKKEKKALEDAIQAKMEDEGFPRVDTQHCSVSIIETPYVTTPKDFDAKKALFDWLEEQGTFYDFATINYQSLNSLYKEKKADGVILPGVGPERTRSRISIRKRSNG